jgi:hypothetical protein
MHRRHASTVEFSLSVFYPPLPSYEGSEEEKSPPLFVPPRHGGDALLWKRGRCVSYEHVGTHQLPNAACACACVCVGWGVACLLTAAIYCAD